MRAYRAVWGTWAVLVTFVGMTMFVAASPVLPIETAVPLFVVMVGCTSPPVVGRLWRWVDGTADGARDGSRPVEVEPYSLARQELDRWSDTELYAVWCSSMASISRATASDHAVTVASAREHLLTEFERRHPEEAAAWLNSGAGLAGMPPRFLLDEDG